MSQSHVLRTPESRFADLPDFPFPPRYVEVDGLRMHYVDEGSHGGGTVLLLHGEPTWSFLYRHMIPPLVAAGFRVVAPDLIGFGRSDKPSSRAAHTYNGHVSWVTTAVRALGLSGITLFCQDWGSLIGLRVVAENPELFDRVVLSNGALPDGTGRIPRVLRLWRLFARRSPVLPIGHIVAVGTVRRLSREERRGYDAPFPDRTFKAGPRALPQLIPLRESDPGVAENRRAWEVFRAWRKPFLTAFSDGDPITRPFANVFRERTPGCQGFDHPTVHGAGHFVQEDKGPELADIVTRFVRAS